jgi:hypothetical protein
MEAIAETAEEATRRGQQVPITRGEAFSLYLERQRALASRSNATLAFVERFHDRAARRILENFKGAVPID